jgi:hypothetical protein
MRWSLVILRTLAMSMFPRGSGGYSPEPRDTTQEILAAADLGLK